MKSSTRFEFFLEKATEIGIKEITPIISKNTLKKGINMLRSTNKIISAMKQSVKYYMPKLNKLELFETFCNNSDEKYKFISTCQDIKKIPVSKLTKIQESTVVLIGPEGDFNKDEIDYAKKNEFGLAINVFKQALHLKPNDYSTYNHLGITYSRNGQPQKAIEAHHKSILIHPNHSVSHFNLGLAYYYSNQTQSAIKSYQRALVLDPDEVKFYNNLSSQINVKTPKPYYVEHNEVSGRVLLLLEYMDGWYSPDQIEGASVKEIELAIEGLIPISSQFWGTVRDIEWIPDMKESYMLKIVDDMVEYQPEFLNRFGHLMTDSRKKLLNKIVDYYPNFPQILSDGILTLTHWDYRVENLFFTPNVDDITVIDWQLMMANKPGWDLAYLLCTNVQIDIRREIFKESCEVYLQGLKNNGIDQEKYSSNVKLNTNEINLARKELASIANYYYNESKKGIESFSPESRIAINACIELYGKLNDRIISRGNDIKYRESLSWSEKLGALPISKYWKLPAAYLKS